MNKDNTTPQTADENLMVVMKGAPDRVIRRCNKILVQGEERDFGEFERKSV